MIKRYSLILILCFFLLVVKHILAMIVGEEIVDGLLAAYVIVSMAFAFADWFMIKVE